MRLLEVVFDPSKDKIEEIEIRLIIYDVENLKFLCKEIISSKEKFTVFVDTKNNSNNLKYKYQKKVNQKWIDITQYKYLLPEKKHHTGLKYILYENNRSDKLVVIFQAISKTQSYNYIKTLKDSCINRLYIKDDYGGDTLTKSSYYLGNNKKLTIAEDTQKLILETARELSITRKNIVFAGSSKGGYAALYHGYSLGIGRIIPGGPQVLLGDYLYQLSPNSLRHHIFKSIVGEFTHDNKLWANNLLYNTLKNADKPYPLTKIHIGVGEPHYNEHVLPFMEWVSMLSITNVTIDKKNYNTHEELAEFYPIFLKDEIDKFIKCRL